MINHYTANRLPRSEDAYSPGGRAGLRPDRATAVYAQRCREAHPDVPVIAGGVEASLRRLAHYDYWSDTVKPSVLVSSKADLVVFGMGERQIVEIVRRLDRGEGTTTMTDVRGTAYADLEVDLFDPDFVPPGGESWEVFHRRVDRAWAAIRAAAAATEGDLAVVTHGLVCASLVRNHLALDGLEPPPPERLVFGNTAVTSVDSEPPWTVRRLACTDHLAGLEEASRVGGAV